MQDKTRLRECMRARRRALAPAARRRMSDEACARARRFLAQRHPAPLDLLLYRALPEELDTFALFRDPPCARLFAPVVVGRSLVWRRADGARWRAGAFSVPEPDGDPWDMRGQAVLLCPLVAFDRAGNRLGMGKGYFDRWLARHRGAVEAVVGLAFSFQEVARVPAERHDAPLDFVITEREVIRCR